MSSISMRELADLSLKDPSGVINVNKTKFDRGEKIDVKFEGSKKSLHIYSSVINSKEYLYVVESSKQGLKMQMAEKNQPFIELESNADRPAAKKGEGLKAPLLANQH